MELVIRRPLQGTSWRGGSILKNKNGWNKVQFQLGRFFMVETELRFDMHNISDMKVCVSGNNFCTLRYTYRTCQRVLEIGRTSNSTETSYGFALYEGDHLSCFETVESNQQKHGGFVPEIVGLLNRLLHYGAFHPSNTAPRMQSQPGYANIK